MFSNPNIFWMSRATVQVLGSHTGSEGWNYLADCPSHPVNKGSCVKSFGNNRNGMKNNCKRSAVFSLEMGYFTVKPKRRLQWVQWSLWGIWEWVASLGYQGKVARHLRSYPQIRKLPSDISFYLGKQRQWKIARTHYRICPYAWYFVSDISVTLQRT